MGEQRKLRVGFVSNCPVGGKTGLSRDMRCLTTELYKKNKYELFFLAQQMQDNDPNFQKLPFRCQGVFKNFDQQRFNQDPNYQRFVAYGNAAVENFVIDNKLDCLILSDDGWSYDLNSYVKTDWYKHIKENVLAKITADSEPILPMIKEWAQECPNFHVWTEFAERALKEEDSKKYAHVKTLHGSINSDEFFPLPKEQRLQLRRNFNIQDDEKICIYLGRNQLRKTAIWANQEALAVFKKKYPNKKLKLLFHLNFGEPGGWPIDNIRDELKLKKEDILCTYYCRTCSWWNIQPHDGEDLDCPVCKAQKSRITAGVGSTITEDDLNKIYNISDFACSNFTSGGLEYFNVESLLAGLPLACTPYSSGETFTKNDFVFPIRSVFTRECGTGFKKAAPVIDSIVEFYNYAYDMNDVKRQRIVEKGRQWAIDNFDGKIIANKLEKFLDSRQPIDWDIYFNKKKELKDLNAQITQQEMLIEDDKQFIKLCYERFLKMSVMDTDEGLIHWLKFIQ